jgi:hypothetical protein
VSEHTKRQEREQPELVELRLLLEKFENERDPERKRQLQREIDKIKAEVAKANAR